MKSFRLLLNLALALALVASGALPAGASAMTHAPAPAGMQDAQDSQPPCHPQAPEAPAPAAAATALDCCDGGDCTCSCLHHAPVVVNVDLLVATVRYQWIAAIGGPEPRPSMASAPAIRPPIA